MILIDQLINEIHTLAHDGGWVFFALIALAFGIAFSLLSLWHSMRLPDAPVLPSRDWLALLKDRNGNPDIRNQLQEKLGGSGDLPRKLQEIGQRLFAKPERRFAFAFIMIGAAPLIGLLGTVSGMFSTFQGMATTSANAPIDVISQGISEALITTQTGLIIGVPTYIACAWLKSRHDDLALKFRQLESQLLQQSSF
tara:strand:- start:210 stop:797 length:588 start_codon:yes stop_codon:yes gene_type:complete